MVKRKTTGFRVAPAAAGLSVLLRPRPMDLTMLNATPSRWRKGATLTWVAALAIILLHASSVQASVGTLTPAATAEDASRLSVATRDAAKVRAGRATKARVRKFPTARSAGVPRGWEPERSVTGDYFVTRAGAVVEDLRVTDGNIYVEAPNVTLRRVEVVGGVIANQHTVDVCSPNLLIHRSTVRRSPGKPTVGEFPAISSGNYTARRVKISGLPEGFRVAGADAGCGRVIIRNSFARITPPADCSDWHGDGLQGYFGPHLVLRNTRLDLLSRGDDCGGTAPFFYPDGQGNTSVDIDGLLVRGGGYSFRLGMPGDVRRLRIVRDDFIFGPIAVKCALIGAWSAQLVRLDKYGQPVKLRRQRCNTDES